MTPWQETFIPSIPHRGERDERLNEFYSSEEKLGHSVQHLHSSHLRLKER